MRLATFLYIYFSKTTIQLLLLWSTGPGSPLYFWIRIVFWCFGHLNNQNYMKRLFHKLSKQSLPLQVVYKLRLTKMPTSVLKLQPQKVKVEFLLQLSHKQQYSYCDDLKNFAGSPRFSPLPSPTPSWGTTAPPSSPAPPARISPSCSAPPVSRLSGGVDNFSTTRIGGEQLVHP